MYKRGDRIEIISSGRKAKVISVKENIICVKLEDFPFGHNCLLYEDIKPLSNVRSL